MKYISTRNKKKFYSFSEIISKGIPDDEGLFIPYKIPKINFKKINYKQKYYKLCSFILSKFMSRAEFKKFKINQILKKVYNKNFYCFKKFICKIKKIKDRNIFILNLNYGKTFSFKDISISFISEFLNYYYFLNNNKTNIITATSGDTGSSCAYYLRKKKNIKTFIFSPYNKISLFQSIQMYSIKKKNLLNISVIGNFDDCQKILKKNLLSFNFNTLNSVNFLRIILQSIYYIKYLLTIKTKYGGNIIFSIPTGNFGNAFSCYLAFKMGLDVFKILVINNENNTLYNLFRNNYFNIKNNVIETNCPSIDIVNPSNIERYFFLKFGVEKNIKIIKNKQFKIDIKNDEKLIKSQWCNEKNRKEILNTIFKSNKILLDTHTSNSLYKINNKKTSKHIIINTAKYIKFTDAINKINKTKKKFKYYELIKKNKKKFFSFLKKDKIKISNFIKKNKF
ncbi:threonine synthase [Candidatus Vidania fulgoroideorum]